MHPKQPHEIRLGESSLEEILQQHERWLESQGAHGARADLRGARLAGIDLSHRNLRGVQFEDADLRGADLSRASLHQARMKGANLHSAALGGADLTESDLAGAELAGADLTIARFSPGAVVVDTGPALRRAKKARWWTIAAAIGSVAATALMARTRDLDFVLDSVWSAVPGFPLTTQWLYALVAPLLLGLFLLWHRASLEPLWRSAARLPAILLDGDPIDQVAALWPVGVGAGAGMLRLRQETPGIEQRAVAVALRFWFWGLVPTLLTIWWWRCLPAQDWLLSAITAASAAVAVGSGLAMYRSTRARFAPAELAAGGRLRGGVAALALMLLVTFGALESRLGALAPLSASIDFGDFSRKNLAGRSLRDARIAYSNLSDATLAGCDLEGARVISSNLQQADLKAAVMRNASLFDSDLKGALLDGADLQGANLRCVRNLTARALEAALTDAETILPNGESGPFQSDERQLAIDAKECRNWVPIEDAPPGILFRPADQR